MTEICRNGHTRTEANTSWVKSSDRGKTRKRCLDCRRDAYKATGTLPIREQSAQSTTYKHEDVEDLLEFGATLNEILDRGGYASWDTLHRSLKRRERFDLIDALKEKKVKV